MMSIHDECTFIPYTSSVCIPSAAPSSLRLLPAYITGSISSAGVVLKLLSSLRPSHVSTARPTSSVEVPPATLLSSWTLLIFMPSLPVPISPSGIVAPSCQKDGFFSPRFFLEANKDLLSIAQQNIQGLLGHLLLLDGRPADTARKIDYLHYCHNLSNTSAILCITVTKIDKKIDDVKIAIPGYSLCCHDRNRRGRGKAIYSHCDFLFLLLLLILQSSTASFVFHRLKVFRL